MQPELALVKSQLHPSLYMKILQLCIDQSSQRPAHLIHSHVITSGLGLNVNLSTKLIIFYSKVSDLVSARKVFDKMTERSVVSWTAMISGYSQVGSYKNALSLFLEMHRVGVKANQFTYGSVLRACTALRCLQGGVQIQGCVQKGRFVGDVFVQTALLDLHAKCGKMEGARVLFDTMSKRDVVSWNGIIGGYAFQGFKDEAFRLFHLMIREGYGKHGYADKAIALYKKMECQGLKPNDITFLSLLFACSHTGLIDEGWKIFSTMVSKYNISPRAEHYSCIIDLFAREGQLEVAYSLISDMNIKPSPSLWGSLLGACRIYGNMALGEVVGMHLLNLEPEKSANYVVLASIYTAVGSWDKAWETRSLMEEKGSMKVPGFSLLSCTEKKMVLLQPY